MFDGLRQSLRRFLAARRGTRFRRQYRRRQAQPHALRTILAIGAGLLLIPIGFALLLLPGPGLLVILIGAGLLGGESLRVARMLDGLDFHAGICYARWRRRWVRR